MEGSLLKKPVQLFQVLVWRTEYTSDVLEGGIEMKPREAFREFELEN
jgi:hypothetical protein